MKFYSTEQKSPQVGLEEAIFKGLPSDNGLFMPTKIPTLSADFLKNLSQKSFVEMAFEVSKSLFSEDISDEDLKNICSKAFDFEPVLKEIEKNTFVLELFHGHSMAFKDFGARYMAALMSYFLQKKNRKIHILVATSGDTGGAVAQGFFKIPAIEVTILYPKGKVSLLQEKQLTTLGENITALEVEGTFDDCQYLVKQAFLDTELSEKLGLASANSINISRLIPQSFYYFYAFGKLNTTKKIVFSVPSGNFGNLSAGLLAQNMGLDISHFIASTNQNHSVPTFLATGNFESHPSVETISNAMDVGNPSNFIRMKLLAGSSIEKIRELVSGTYYSDEITEKTIQYGEKELNYLMCPHTAIAYQGWKEYQKKHPESVGVFLSTAHWAKFLPTMERVLQKKLDIPENLKSLLTQPKKAISMDISIEKFKHYLRNK